jgi:acyl dehydratase
MPFESTDADAMLTADDLEVHHRYDLGSFRVTEHSIIEFASQWDPLPIHCDVEVAREGFFGGIVASGVHTLAIFQRLAAKTIYSSWAVIAGRRITDIGFPHPVRGGMTLHGVATVTDIRRDRSDRALVSTDGRLTVADQAVLTLRSEMYVRRALT